MSNYISNVLVAFDQFVNVLFGGYPDETISSRCGRGGNYFSKFMQWWLGKIQHDHCEMAIIHDDQRALFVASVEAAARAKGQ